MSTEPTGSAIAILRVATFRRLWLAALTSNFGNFIQAVAAAWMMTLLTPSEGMVALVQTATMLPIMLFSLASGVLADNYDRRKVMLVAQLLMLVLSLVLSALAIAGLVTPWVLLVLTFLIGSGAALHNPSWQASVGDIVRREEVPLAVGANAMGYNIVRSIGPAIGGAVVAALGVTAAFILNALTYVALILALLNWKPDIAARRLPREPFGSAIVAGVRYVSMSPAVLSVVLRSSVFGFAAIFVQALLPIIARDGLNGGAGLFGLLLGCFGVGAIVGGLMSPQLRARFSLEQIVRACFLGTAVTTAIVTLSTSAIVTAVTMVIAGAFWLNAMALFNTTVQMSTPRWVVGRAISIFQMGAFGFVAVGSWVWGLLAEHFGLPTSMMVCVTTLGLGTLMGLFAPLREFTGRDLDPVDRFREPPVQLDLRERSGPILILVEYRIDQGDVEKFLELMAQRRRSRIRDGARNWALLRDLETPDLWHESYHVPTWLEYVRHHSRRTREDAELADRLNALHRGELPLRVYRKIERQAVPTRDDAPPIGPPTI